MKRIFLFAFMTLCFVFSACAEEITIESLNVSFKVPEHIEWATRTEGNYDIMQATYHMNRDDLIAYMQSAEEYFKGVDTTSDLRILITSLPAEADDRNSSVLSNAELLQTGAAVEQMLGGTAENVSVYETASGNKFLKLNCHVLGQTMCLGSTCLDGIHHTIVVRGTNVGYLDTMLSYILETFKSNEKSQYQAEQTISIKEAVFSIPGRWEKVTLDSNPGVESVFYCTRGTDGLVRYFTCNVVDLCTSLELPEEMRSFWSGNQYSKQLTILLATEQGITTDKIREYAFGDKQYYGYQVVENGCSAVRVCVVENGYMYCFIFESFGSGDVFQDECYPDFNSILNSAEYY